MSKLDRLCKTLLDEQDLHKNGKNLSQFRLGNFRKRYEEIEADIRLAKMIKDHPFIKNPDKNTYSNYVCWVLETLIDKSQEKKNE
ncbi:hypothetical protein LCGC14_0586140 [marine sediment metagenome]|uniref:Uncharacterized protein n=1 Tax=marine sediment metagenome TaxID=412755 RepID=A0A0F9UN28_9ZZZZ